MPRNPAPALAATAAALIILVVPAQAAAVGDPVMAISRDRAHRVTARPGPTTSTHRRPLRATGGCSLPRVRFGETAYCPANIADVRATTYGIGARVVLKGVTVTTVTATTVTVAVWALPPCTAGNFCGATLSLQTLTVSWSGTDRPAYGDVLNLFGSTVAQSIVPAGFIRTGNCPIDLC